MLNVFSSVIKFFFGQSESCRVHNMSAQLSGLLSASTAAESSKSFLLISFIIWTLKSVVPYDRSCV